MELGSLRNRRLHWGIGLLVLPLVGALWVQRASLDAGKVPEISQRIPVIFVPGVTGVRLRDEATGRMQWGTGRSLMSPHDRGHAIALSIDASRPGPRLAAAGAVLDLRLFGIFRFRIYQRLVEAFEDQGYQTGDLEVPRPGDDFFLFSYDWRQDNVVSADRLARQLETLGRVRGEKRLRVNLICQSNGAHICRYFTRYGGAKLSEAEAGRPERPGGTTVAKLILVGASNGGSIRVLRELDRGRRYIDLIGRYWSPETLFTFRSLFQDLPAYTTELFVDERGGNLPVDLFDPDVWHRYGWSVLGRKSQRILAKPQAPEWLGTTAGRDAYLAQTLERARRFQRVLHADRTDLGSTEYSLLAVDERETSCRAVLVERSGGWETWFGDDRRVRRSSKLHAVTMSPGDGHATTESQRWLSPQERQRLGSRVYRVEGKHRGMVLEDATHRRIFGILVDEPDSGS